MEPARWTFPAARMKGGREFCVPLSRGALDVPDRARALSPEPSLVFPSNTGGLLARTAPGRVLREPEWPRHSTGPVRAPGRGWPSPESLRRLRRPASPTCRNASSFGLVSAPNLVERRAEVLQAWCDCVTPR